MAEAHTKHHDYHLVDPSPWPIIGAVGAFLTALGLIFAMHADLPQDATASDYIFRKWGLIVPGMLIVLYTMYGWWAEVIKEAHRGDHTRVVQLHLRYGMILFIASEVMFFVAWFWAFFDASLYPAPRRLRTARSSSTLATSSHTASGRRSARRCSIPGTCPS